MNSFYQIDKVFVADIAERSTIRKSPTARSFSAPAACNGDLTLPCTAPALRERLAQFPLSLGPCLIHHAGQQQSWLSAAFSSVPGLAYSICIKTHVTCQILTHRF